MNTITLHIGDIRDVMADMADSSVDLIVTSPPFLALRSYLPADHPDKHREIGSEATPAAYLDTLLELTQTWRRLLTPTGSLAVELGDTYSGSGGAGGDYDPGGWREGQQQFRQNKYERVAGDGFIDPDGRSTPRAIRNLHGKVQGGGPGWPLPKSLCGIPTLYAWSLAYGRNLLDPLGIPFDPWRIRNLLTWTRPNPPVGALGDKFRPATSYVTVACTSDKRWFDLDGVRGDVSEWTKSYADRIPISQRAIESAQQADKVRSNAEGLKQQGAPPLDWWDQTDDWQPLHRLPTHPYKGAHYATYPPQLPRRLIEAMCPREVCVVCGEARRRIRQNQRDSYGGLYQVKGNPNRADNGASQFPTADYVTLGWTNCGHYNDNLELVYRPGIVLDPFAGSGTTAIAAAQVGRDSVLIDLDPRSVDLIRQRLTETMRVIDEHNDGDTWTWTVTPATRLEVDAIAAGQLTLFDLTA